MSKVIVPDILRFISMLFNVIFFSMTGGYRDIWGLYLFLLFDIKEIIGMFKICMYPFLTWLFFSMNGGRRKCLGHG